MGSLTSMVPDCTAEDCPAHKFIEKFLTYRFVMGVRAEFDSIRTRLLHDSSALKMTKVLLELLAEETRLRSLTSPPTRSSTRGPSMWRSTYTSSGTGSLSAMFGSSTSRPPPSSPTSSPRVSRPRPSPSSAPASTSPVASCVCGGAHVLYFFSFVSSL